MRNAAPRAISADQLDRDRLVKVCGLFSSENDGERAAAAARVDQILRQAGLRWPDVIQPALPPPVQPDTIDFCLAHQTVLTLWEAEFIAALARQSRRRPSQKQQVVLERFVQKVRRRLCQENAT